MTTEHVWYDKEADEMIVISRATHKLLAQARLKYAGQYVFLLEYLGEL